mgnify:FL=1
MINKSTTNQKPQPLTPKEKGILEFLEIYIGRHGLAPSFQEIKDHFGFASFNSVQRYLKQLEEKNYIQVPGENRKRAITLINSASSVQKSVASLTDKQQNQQQPGAAFSGAFSPMYTQTRIERGAAAASFAEPLSLPLLGKVAAGHPIEALTDNEFVDVPASFVRNAGKSYALQVQGNSMVDDGIHDRDVILVQEQNHARDSEIVVAVVDNEATVKRLYSHRKAPAQAVNHVDWQGPVIELRPSNSEMQSLWFHPDQVEIRGVVVGLLRKYF